MIAANYFSISSLLVKQRFRSRKHSIERGDFQHPEYDKITVSFRNPTKETKTIANISVICETHSGLINQVPTINNLPQKLHPFKNTTAVPFSISPGEPKQVELVVMKHAKLMEINQHCKKIRAAWTNDQFIHEFGDFTDIFKDEAMFSQTIINRKLMNH